MAMNGVEKRLPAFWFNTAVVSRSCSQGQNYLNSTGYRKVVSNNCIKGVKDMYTPRKQMFPNRAPKDLSLSTREGKLTADLHTNVTFLVHLDEGTGRISGRIWSQWQLEPLTTAADSVEAEQSLLETLLAFQGNSMRTKIQLDFGDGTAVSYSILRWIEEGIRHIYKAAGYSVSRPWQKTPWDLRLPPCNSMLRPVISLDGSILYTFTSEAMNTVTVQVSSANAILQDTKAIEVQGVRLSRGSAIGCSVSRSEILASDLNQNLVAFELKPEARVIV
ncbi:VPS10 domain-containing receptor SorCS1-like isoform X3 [Salvelinus fontinalis]|nr:VPS10 domain-containing receptor SorCS1-like isoform X3 [Salvelinus fontinalis]